MTDDRAQELSGRWEKSDDNDSEQSNTRTDREGEQASKTNRHIDEKDEHANKQRKLTTRERESQMVYLRPDQYERIHGAWLDLEYRFGRKRGIDLEKSRDFLVPLLELGLSQLGDVESRELDELANLLDIDDE